MDNSNNSCCIVQKFENYVALLGFVVDLIIFFWRAPFHIIFFAYLFGERS